MIRIIAISIISFLFLSGCRDKEEIKPVTTHNQGFFVVNEGNYTWANSSLSYYDAVADKLYSDIFYEANGVPLGDVAFSMTIHNNKGYIVVNNSGIIYVVNLNDMKFSGKITGLTSPRQMLIINDSIAYVSDLYDTRIAKINITTNTISGYINIGRTTEKMISQNGRVFVTCWSFGNMIYSFDALNGANIDSATVGKQPNSIVPDKNNNLWVLCDGGFTGSTYGQEKATLWCLNPNDMSSLKYFTFPDIQSSPIRLCADATGDSIYFINNGIQKMCITDNILPTVTFIPQGTRNFYGLNVNKSNGDIIVTDAKNYVANGEILMYSKKGQLKKMMAAGVNPGWIEIMNQ